MFKKVAPLHREHHANILFNQSNDYTFAEDLTVVALSASELPEASAFYPIVFAPADAENPYPRAPLALLGLAGKNVFVDNAHHWTVAYIPAAVRKYPFTLIAMEGANPDKPNLVMGIDESAPHFSTTSGQKLFADEGGASDLSRFVSDFLLKHHEELNATEAALREIADADILINKPITVTDNGKDHNLGEVRIVSRDKLNTLPESTLARWAKNGTLELIAAHWHSLRHLSEVVIATAQKASGAPLQ